MIVAGIYHGYDGYRLETYDNIQEFFEAISNEHLSDVEAYVVSREINVRQEFEEYRQQKTTLRAEILAKLTPFEQRILGVS